MISAWKDIAVFLDTTGPGEKVTRHAANLAKRHKSHLVGVYGASKVRGNPSESFARGPGVAHVIERHRLLNEDKVLDAGRTFALLTEDLAVSSEFRVVWRDAADQDAPLRSLHCDLIVAGHPKPAELPESWTAERLLLATGTPVLMIPETWDKGEIGQTIVVAWNGSREIRRAVNDALPFLTLASRVVVLIVDGVRQGGVSEDDPGGEIMRHLQRHGVVAELLEVESNGVPTPQVIAQQSADLNADLLIVGAYSRHRTSAFLFGSITRSLIEAPALPLFLSR